MCNNNTNYLKQKHRRENPSRRKYVVLRRGGDRFFRNNRPSRALRFRATPSREEIRFRCILSEHASGGIQKKRV